MTALWLVNEWRVFREQALETYCSTMNVWSLAVCASGGVLRLDSLALLAEPGWWSFGKSECSCSHVNSIFPLKGSWLTFCYSLNYCTLSSLKCYRRVYYLWFRSARVSAGWHHQSDITQPCVQLWELPLSLPSPAASLGLWSPPSSRVSSLTSLDLLLPLHIFCSPCL